MKKKRLVRYLVSQGCFQYRQGSDHEFWRSADGQCGAALPRHAEIKTPTMRRICRELGIPVPPEK